MTWQAPPLGSLVRTIVPARDKPEDLTGPIPWLRIEDFDGKYIGASRSGQGVSPETITEMNLRVFPTGTVVCSCSCDMGTTAITRRPLITNQTFIGLVPRSNRIVPDFLYYSLQAHRPQLDALATGAIQSYLSRDDFRALRLPLPEPSLQLEIADFLDAETARIDALIEKKRRMIELLGEHNRTAIDGLVGSHQPKPAVRHVISRLTSGPRGWAAYASEEGPLFLRIANLQRDDVELDLGNASRMSPPSGAEAERTRVREGDVLISITADIGSVGVARAEHKGAHVSQHIALLSPRSCSGEWLAYALSTSYAQSQLDAARYGGTKTQLALEDVAEVRVPLPSRPVQEQALVSVRHVVGASRAATATLSRQIDLLREHRQALITAAVTGQLDVATATGSSRASESRKSTASPRSQS